MVRRCMEGNRRFGMAQLSRDDRSLEDVLVEAEITDCHPLPDGRYYLEIVGRRRLTLMESWELDGYRMAKVRPFGDEPPAAGSAQEAELPGLAAAVEGLTSTWVERIRMFAAASRRGDRVREFLERAGDKPPASQPERLSFWSATLLVSFMPELDASDRVRLLRMRTTHERLAFLRGCLEDRGPGGRGDHEGCALM